MMAFYFHRIQHRLIRNYSIFTEHYFWLVCAARSTAEAQNDLPKMDPKAKFDFSYVGSSRTYRYTAKAISNQGRTGKFVALEARKAPFFCSLTTAVCIVYGLILI